MTATTDDLREFGELLRLAIEIGREVGELRENGLCGTPAEAVERLAEWAASSSVGNPAIRSAPNAMSGRRARRVVTSSAAWARLWRRFIRLRIRS